MINLDESELYVKNLMKERFNYLISVRELKHNSCLITPKKLLRLIAEVQKAKAKIRKTHSECWLLKRYDILKVDGEIKLIVPVKKNNESIICYCSSDELFDILYEAHITIGHGGRDKMIKTVNCYYKNITQNDIMMFLSVCEDCASKRKLILKPDMKTPAFFLQIISITNQYQKVLKELMSSCQEEDSYLLHGKVIDILR